jgi:SAM-dependent methyltransferase
MSNFLSSEYWNDRYIQNDTGWDIGMVSPPIKEYLDVQQDRNLKILIPGCGMGHEGKYLFERGFEKVHLLDFSPEPILKFQSQNPKFPSNQLHIENFFEHRGNYDLIIEQTLFCAIDPDLRVKYAKKVLSLLRDGGKLVGLLFDRIFEGGPPFGGNKEEYSKLFNPLFSSVQIEKCMNSIGPRNGTEVFIEMVK